MGRPINPRSDADWDTMGGEYLEEVTTETAQELIDDLVDCRRESEEGPYYSEEYVSEYRRSLEAIVPEQLEKHRMEQAEDAEAEV